MTFINLLEKKLKDYTTIDNFIDHAIYCFTTYGQYLNQIPKEHQEGIAETLSQNIYLYFLELDHFNKFKNKKSNTNKTTQPIILIQQDIKSLEKARELILNKVYHKYPYFNGIADNLKIEEDKKKFYIEYEKTKKYFIDEDRPHDLKATEVSKIAYDTYWNLTDMINDLKEKKFEFFEENNYYPVKKPNKNEIKEILQVIRLHLNFKSSVDEKQLIDNL